MMHVGLVIVDVPEACDALAELAGRQEAERRIAFDVTVEGDLGAGPDAYGHIRLPRRGKATSDRVVEARGDQLVSDLGGSGGDRVEAIVAHRRCSSCCEQPERLSFFVQHIASRWRWCVRPRACTINIT